MEENPTPPNDSHSSFDDQLCLHCQQNFYESGHPLNLCSGCRKELIKYPVPKAIKFFAIGIAAVMVISLIRTQHYVSAAIHLGKAERAIENKQYLSAKQQLVQVLNEFPDDMTANAYMMVASAYNFDYNSYGIAYNRIADQKTEDEELLHTVNEASDFLSRVSPKDTLFYKKIVAGATDKHKLLSLLDSTKESVLMMAVANNLYDLKAYTEAENISATVLATDTNCYMAISLMSALKRNAGKYDEALHLCDKLLSFNKEDIYAISQKARIELKRKHDKAAAQYADQAVNLDANHDSALEAKAMVDYYLGRKAASLASLAKIKAHEDVSGDHSISTRLASIINGTDIYR